MPDNIQTLPGFPTTPPSFGYTPSDTPMPTTDVVQAAAGLGPTGDEYANSISSGESITDLINDVQSLQKTGQDLLNNRSAIPNSPSPGGFNPDASFQDLSRAINPETPTLKAFAQEREIGSVADYNRYKDSKYFGTFGYNPNLGSQQEYNYGQAQTWGDTIGNAIAGGSHLAYDTFVEGWKGWGRMTEALFTWDSSKLMGSEEERYQIAKEQEDLMNKYAIYDTAESKDSLWNRQLFGNMLQQSGFAVGAIAQFAMEEFLTAGLSSAISPLTKGLLVARVAKGAAETAEKATMVGRAIEGAKNLFRPKVVTTAEELINTTREVANTVTRQERILNSLTNGLKALTPGYGTVEEMIKINRAGAGFAQLAYVGLGGVKRGLSEFNMSRSESIFEAASTYKQLQDKLVGEYITRNGKAPEGDELEKIKQSAEDASHDNFWTNIGVLSVMNRIQFNNMFNGFSKSRSLLGEGAAPLAGKAFAVTGQVEGKAATRFYKTNNLFGRMGAIGEIAKTFGKKEAAWQATKSVGKGLMKFEGSEGLQELIQTASGQGLENYYTDLYHGKKGYTGKLESVMTSLEDTAFTMEGMKTFLMGALTGRLIAPMHLGVTSAIGAVQDSRNAKKAAESYKTLLATQVEQFTKQNGAAPNADQLKQIEEVVKESTEYKTTKEKVNESVALLNNISTDPAWFKKEAIANIKVQNEAVETMDQAAANSNKYVFNNVKDSALAKAVASAIKLDLYSSLRGMIKEYGDGMSDKEFKEAFGIDPTETTKKNVRAITDSMVDGIEDYYNTYKILKDKYADRIIPELYKNNKPEDYRDARLQKAVLDDIIELVATNSFKAKKAIVRASELQTEIGQNKNVGASSLQILTSMGSVQAIDDNIRALKMEIYLTEQAETLTPEQREIFKDKKKELELAEKWQQAYQDLLDNEDESYSPATEGRAYQAFADMVNLFNQRNKNTTTVSKEDVDDVFIKFHDYIKLNRDNKDYVDAMNILADPKNMTLLAIKKQEGLQKIMNKFREELLAEIEKLSGINIDRYTVEKNEDGTFRVVDTKGDVVQDNITTEEEANKIAVEKNKEYEEELAKEEAEEEQPEELTDIEAKKADIERRRQEENNRFPSGETIFKKINPDGENTEVTDKQKATIERVIEGNIKDGKTPAQIVEVLNQAGYTVNYGNETTTLMNYLEDRINGVYTTPFFEFNNKLRDKINAKYDAELAALEAEPEEEEVPPPPADKIVSDTDPEFTIPYNEALKQIQQIVNKPGVFLLDALKAFSVLNPILAKLDKETKVKYIRKHTEEKEAVKNRIKAEQESNDIAGAKKQITEALASDTASFNETFEQLYSQLNLKLKPEYKEEAIKHFEQEYVKAVDKRIAKLTSLINVANTSEGLTKLLELSGKFKADIEKVLNLFKKKAEELKAKKSGKNYIVGVNPDFTNPVHRSILNFRDTGASVGQTATIDSFLDTGLLSQEDVDSYDSNSKHGASELINLGVNRILTLELYKGMQDHFKKNDSTKLKKTLKDYLIDTDSRLDDKKLSKEERDEILQEINATVEYYLDKTDEAFSNEQNLSIVLDLPVSNKDVISDEEYKLFNEYRKAVGTVISNSVSLDRLDQFSKHFQTLLSVGATVSTKEMLPTELVELLTPFLKKTESGVNFELFYNDIIEGFDKIKSADRAVMMKTIKEINDKHIKQGTDGLQYLQSLYAGALQTNNLLESEDDGSEPLTDIQMLAALDNPTVSLNKQQVAQVEEFAKGEQLDNYKKKLNAAVGYSDDSVVYTPELLDVSPIGPRFNSLRPKFSNDQRTTEDLSAYLTPDENGVVNTIQALNFIVYSSYATDAEKQLAKRFLEVVTEDDTIKVDNSLQSSGDFDPETNQIRINLAATGYNRNRPSSAIETVILHEMVHGLIEKAIADPTSSYAKSIKSLFNAIKDKEGANTFYAFQDFLSPDEQLREFVTEAFTNPAFQYLLATTPYGKTNQSLWDRFMQIVSDVLASIGINIEGTVLEKTLSLTNELFNKEAIIESDKFPSEAIMDKIKLAKTEEELNEIRKEVDGTRKNYQDDVYNALLASITRKIQSVNYPKVKESLKEYTSIKINGQTYYYNIKNNKVNVVKLNHYVLDPVKNAVVLAKVAAEVLAKNKITKILSKETIDLIKDLGGDPQDRGSYASREMLDAGQTLMEQRYPNIINQGGAKLLLNFGTLENYRKFKNDWNRYSKKQITLDDLNNLYSKAAVGDFAELYNSLQGVGGKSKFYAIDKLIRKGLISLDRTKGGQGLGDLTYDTDLPIDELMDFYKDIANDVKLDEAESESIRKYINNVLSKFLGTPVSNKLQAQLENEIFSEGAPGDVTNIPDTFDITEEGGNINIVSDLANKEYVEDPTVLDIKSVAPELSISPNEPYALRSKGNDGVNRNGEFIEYDDFKNYYYKIRNIINALSKYSAEQVSDLYITLVKDSADLRWDGSSQSEGWVKADKGVIGYISDKDGNPVVFDKDGKRIGRADKNNPAASRFNNGENQIVYFTTATPKSDSRSLANFEKESLAKLFATREAVMNGEPHIAKVIKITKGQFQLKQMVRAQTKSAKNTIRDKEFNEQVNQDHVSFRLEGSNLLLVVTGEKDITNESAVFTPRAKDISIVNADGTSYTLFDHLIELMKTFQEMQIANNPNLGNIENELVLFAQNMWYSTGDRQSSLQMPKTLKSIGIREDMKNPQKDVLLSLFTIKDGQVIVNEKNIEKVKKHMEQLKVNVAKIWLEGKQQFKFPYVEVKNGKKTINFEPMDYKDFLVNKVGLISYIGEIKTKEELKSYNSSIHFLDPVKLNPTAPAVNVTEEKLINDTNAVEDAVKKAVDNATPVKKNIRIPGKDGGKTFKAPLFDKPYEKICK